VKALAKEIHGMQAQVLEISIDCNQSDYNSWISKHSPEIPVLNACRREHDLDEQLNISGYPTTVVLGTDRVERGRFVGVWNSRTTEDIKRLVRESF
jgi:hypothetical protein